MIPFFRNAAIGDSEVTLWVMNVISGAGWDFRFTPNSDQTAALH
jgi:hypothetical protein